MLAGHDVPARARGAAGRRAARAADGAPSRPARAPRPRSRDAARGAAVHGQIAAPGRVPLRDAGRAAGRDDPRPRLVRHPWQADDRRLHPARHRDLRGRERQGDRLRRRALRRRPARRLRVRPVHGRPRPPLRRRAARRYRRAGIWRQYVAAAAAARGSRRVGPLLHAELRAAAGGARPGPRHQAALRPLRCRAVVGGDAREARGRVGHRRLRRLRSRPTGPASWC